MTDLQNENYASEIRFKLGTAWINALGLDTLIMLSSALWWTTIGLTFLSYPSFYLEPPLWLATTAINFSVLGRISLLQICIAHLKGRPCQQVTKRLYKIQRCLIRGRQSTGVYVP